MADGIGNAGDDLRTGWYPDEGSLTPQLVSGSTFGQLWSAQVDGQVYAQPLFTPSSRPNGTLIVATENDVVYGLDPATGSLQWKTPVAPNGPWNPMDIGCGDIQPSIGTTSTPVIDTSSGTVYLTHKTYDANHDAVWFLDALDVNTGQEQPGFPVELSGAANNDPSLTFAAQTQQQRPGLLLMNGVVYAAFGSHCDTRPWQGWVFGVSTTKHVVTARWVDTVTASGTPSGGGIWQSGVGLTSDGPGQILFAAGNGGAPSSPTAGSAPPPSCGECVMRLQVQSDGSLKAVDFFAPYDADQLDQGDLDFGSGGVVGLPDQYFGSTALPHLAVTVGKEGYVYLLNRDRLGGYDQGLGGGDAVIQRLGPRGGVWGRPGVWPGDGGYMYITTSTQSNGGGRLDVYSYGVDSSGTPTLSLAASSSDVFGWGSGPTVISSDHANNGSAVVWDIWSQDRQGDGGQLRAYSAVPVGQQLDMLGSWPIGRATNYSSPGLGAGRLYVGTRDGTILAFGSPDAEPLSGMGLSFPATTEGSTSASQSLTMTAQRGVTITKLTVSPSDFALQAPSLPITLKAGDPLSVPVTFTPSRIGPVAGQLTASTDQGDVTFSLSGSGEATDGLLQASPARLSMGGTTPGSELTGTVRFSNAGGQPLTVQDVTTPRPPFSTGVVPAQGYQLAPEGQAGSSVTIDISFKPQSLGRYSDAITLDTTDGQSQTIQLSGSATTPGLLEFSTQDLDFGAVTVGSTATRTFTISNAGGTAVTIGKSKPPFGGAFAAVTSLPEGLSIQPGQTVTETVTFTPTSAGSASGAWQITGDDGSGLHQVQFTGTGTTASIAAVPSGPFSGGPGSTATGAGATPKLPRAPKFTPARASAGRLATIYLTYTAGVAGISRFALERSTGGRRTARGCVPATSRNRFLPACTRFVVVRTFIHHDRAGTNKLRLGVYVPVSELIPGEYRLRSIMLDAAGVKHTSYSLLRIVAAPSRHPSKRAATIGPALADVLRRLAALL